MVMQHTHTQSPHNNVIQMTCVKVVHVSPVLVSANNTAGNMWTLYYGKSPHTKGEREREQAADIKFKECKLNNVSIPGMTLESLVPPSLLSYVSNLLWNSKFLH
jgi:hypothetical protein